MNFKQTLTIVTLTLGMGFSTTTFAGKVTNSNITSSKTVQASYYSKQHHNRKTANGERFNMYALTAAHKTLPFNCKVKVTNKSNGKSVIVRINDRGPFHGNRALDLSYAAAKTIGMIPQGVSTVSYEILK